ncbi:MAG: hypothetical protein KAV99_01845 [Candidatus Latescibacteria bacterium]|nr:hypothetical protein [Candidatus Latescibacterota bacterium]
MTVIGIQHQREPGKINNAVDTRIGLPGFDHLGSNGPLERRRFLYPAEGTECAV